MVLKLESKEQKYFLQFESSVNSDGTQTYIAIYSGTHKFESSVNSDGTQTA